MQFISKLTKMPFYSKLQHTSRSLKLEKNLSKTRRLEQELVWDRIHNNRWKKNQLRLEISSKLTLFLGRISMIDDRTRIQQYLDKSYDSNSIWSRYIKLWSWRRWKPSIWKSNSMTHQWKLLLTSLSDSKQLWKNQCKTKVSTSPLPSSKFLT